MKLKKHIPLIIAPYSKSIVGGIGSWTKSLMVYSERKDHQDIYQIHYYANHLMAVTNTKYSARISSGIILYSKLVCQLFVLILRYKPSVLHVATSATLGLIKDLIIIGWAKLTKIPIVIHWHFGRIPELAKANNWEWRLLKHVVRNSSNSIVIDNKSYNTLIERGFSNVVNIPNPISIDIEKKARAQLMQRLERPHGRVLYVGHVLREKGVFELVEACIAIPAIDELIIIGPSEGNILKELMMLSNKRNNGTWLKLLGQKNEEEVLNYMTTSQILTLPSYTEGFPIVLVEAMAMGCAVIATDVGAIPEMIDSGGENPCGICVPIRDIEKLKEAILDLVNNPEKAEEMGQSGIEKVLNNYTIDKVIGQYMKVWDNVIQ